MAPNTGWPLFFSTALVCMVILLTVGTWDNNRPLVQIATWFTQMREPRPVASSDQPGLAGKSGLKSAPQARAVQVAEQSDSNARAASHSDRVSQPRPRLKRRPSVSAPIALIPNFEPMLELNGPAGAETQADSKRAVPAQLPTHQINKKLTVDPAIHRSARPDNNSQFPFDDIVPKQLPTMGVQPKQQSIAHAWPIANDLIEKVNLLGNNSKIDGWKRSLCKTLQQIHELPSLSDPAADVLIKQLLDHSQYIEQSINELDSRSTKASAKQLNSIVQLKHVQYHLSKRVELWTAVHELAVKGIQQPNQLQKQAVKPQLLAQLRSLRNEISDQSWIDYLLLDYAEQILSSRRINDPNATRLTQAILQRIDSPVLNDQQWSFAHELIDEHIKANLKVVAAEPVDLSELLQSIEELESCSTSAANYRLARQYQQLIWCQTPPTIKVAHAIQTHYRNANFRLAGETRFLTRMMMLSEKKASDPTYVTMQNDSEIMSSSDNSGWTLTYTKPTFSVTSSTQTPASADSQKFRIQKHFFGQSPIEVGSSEHIFNSIESITNKIPLINFVKAQYQLHDHLTQQSLQAQNVVGHQYHFAIYQNLIAPLTALGLEPQAIDLQSSQDRLLLRGRVAASDQLAAFSARPKAIDDCLASMQIHQSFFNNLFEKSRIEHQVNTFGSLKLKLTDILGINLFNQSHSRFDTYKCQLSTKDSIRITFDEGLIRLQLRLIHDLKNFDMSVTYQPYVENGRVYLTRLIDQPQIQSASSDVDPVFTSNIAKQLFAHRIEIPSPNFHNAGQIGDLTIAQFVVNEGWIGIAWISEDRFVFDPAKVTLDR
jgi:hypothetical protein